MLLRLSIIAVLAVIAVGSPTLADLKRIYYINLDSAVERRQHMEAQLKELGVTAIRFSAVDSHRLASDKTLQAYLKQGLDDDLLAQQTMPGTLACAISHMETIKDATAHLGPNDLALILEDDVRFQLNWQDLLRASLAAAPQDWALLRVSGWGETRVKDEVSRPLSWWRHLQSKLLFIGTPYPDPAETVVYQMREPFKENCSMCDLGSRFFYAGAGAYLVRGATSEQLLRHVHGRRIKDFDGMLLSDGSFPSYEAQPHSFYLSLDHEAPSSLHYFETKNRLWQGSMLHRISSLFGSYLGANSSDSTTSDDAPISSPDAAPWQQQHVGGRAGQKLQRRSVELNARGEVLEGFHDHFVRREGGQ